MHICPRGALRHLSDFSMAGLNAGAWCTVFIVVSTTNSAEYTWKDRAWGCESQEACEWADHGADLGEGMQNNFDNSDNDNTNFECPPGNDPALWINTIKVNNDDALGVLFCAAAGTSGSSKNDDGLSFIATGGNTGVSYDANACDTPDQAKCRAKGPIKDAHGNKLDASVGATRDGTKCSRRKANAADQMALDKLPCTVAAISRMSGKDELLEYFHNVTALSGSQQFQTATFKAESGTKTCSATARFLHTGALDVGTGASVGNREWFDDKIRIRAVTLTVCVHNTASTWTDSDGNTLASKCAERKAILGCEVGCTTGCTTGDWMSCSTGTTTTPPAVAQTVAGALI